MTTRIRLRARMLRVILPAAVALAAARGGAAERDDLSRSAPWRHTGLSITYDLPTDPALVCDDAPAVQVGLESATLDPANDKQMPAYAEYVAGHAKDLEAFVLRKGYIPLQRHGPTIVAPLPPYTDVVVYARGVLPHLVAWRTNRLVEGSLTPVHFSAEELFPVRAPKVDIESRLLLESTDLPVPGADIRADGQCYHARVASDDQGHFALRGVPADRRLTVQIAARDAYVPPRFDFAVTRVVHMTADIQASNIAWRIPASRTLTVRLDGTVFRPDEGFPVYGMDREFEPGQWRWERVEHIAARDDVLDLVVSRPGRWRARIHEGFFRVRYSNPVRFDADEFAKETALAPAPPMRDRVVLHFLNPDGMPAAHVAVHFAALTAAGEPLEIPTSTSGDVIIGPLNVDRVGLWVDGPEGLFSGPVLLRETGPTLVQLARRADPTPAGD